MTFHIFHHWDRICVCSLFYKADMAKTLSEEQKSQAPFVSGRRFHMNYIELHIGWLLIILLINMSFGFTVYFGLEH